MTTKTQQRDKRPQNREVEDEMIRPPAGEGQPPRPATEPKRKTTVIL